MPQNFIKNCTPKKLSRKSTAIIEWAASQETIQLSRTTHDQNTEDAKKVAVSSEVETLV